jgi:DNA-directed RNA polymerase subunit D
MKSSDPETVPADDNIPIVELKEGQKIVLTAVARLGKGREHAKFQPVCAAGYKNVPIITVTEKCDLCKMCVEACPQGIYKMERGKLVVGNENKCTMCKLCIEACDAGAINITSDPRSFIYTIETDGSFTAQEIIVRAARSLKDRAEQLGDILENF